MKSERPQNKKRQTRRDPNDGALIPIEDWPPIHEEDAEFLTSLGFTVSRRERRIAQKSDERK